MAAPSAANCPTTAAATSTRRRRRRGDCFGGVQYFFTGTLPAEQRGHRKSAADAQRHPRFLPAGKRLRLYVDLRRPVYAAEPDRRNRRPTISKFPMCPTRRSAMAQSPLRCSEFPLSIRRQLNENQYEQTQFGVLALQRSVNGFDGQLSYFTRYNDLHFMPDPVGDLLLNGIASDISRQSYTNGIQGDASYMINAGAYAARRLHCQRRTDLGRQYSLVQPDGVRRHRQRPLAEHHRRRRQARLARRRLCAGRVEDHRPADDECRRCASTRCGNMSMPIS